jgi:hypothetical protein
MGLKIKKFVKDFCKNSTTAYLCTPLRGMAA